MFVLITVKNIWTNEDRKNGKNGKTPVRGQSPITLQSSQNMGTQNRPNRGASQHPSNSGSPLVKKYLLLDIIWELIISSDMIFEALAHPKIVAKFVLWFECPT